VSNLVIDQCFKDIRSRQLAGDGFAELAGGAYRPDATAWAVLALKAAGLTGAIQSARSSLEQSQLKDGRVSMPGEEKAFWPTSLAVLAWHGSIQHREAQNRALRFLLEIGGSHWKRKHDSPIQHDTALQGWSWTEGTHSWIEPTALAMIALELTGQTNNPRFKEGIQLIVDRQLPQGGWNYGNTVVYCKTLHPLMDTTGLALNALAGHVEMKDVEKSILLLQSKILGSRTPLSLGWSLFGLGAWEEFPKQGLIWVEECLERQDKYGAYRTSLLSLLALAAINQGNFRKCVA
jgi:hypothetical protein